MIWVDIITCSNIKETKMNARVKFNWCFTASVVSVDVAAAVAAVVVSVIASYVVAQLKVIWGYCRVFVKSSSIKKFKNFVPA